MRNFIDLVENEMNNQFPIVTQNISGRRLETFNKAVNDIESGVAAGEILNPVFKDAKDYFNRGIQGAWDQIKKDNNYFHYDDGNGGRIGDEDNVDDKTKQFFWSFLSPQAHLVPGHLKKAEAALAKYPDNRKLQYIVALLKEIAPMSAKLVSLKDKVVKRVIKSDEEKRQERFVPPPARTASSQAVTDALTSIAERSFEGLKEKMIANFLAAGKRFEDIVERAKTDPEFKNRIAPRGRRISPTNLPLGPAVFAIQKAFGVSKNGSWEWDRRSDTDNILIAEATRFAEEARDEFVVKNAKKLAPIVDKKDNLTAVQEIGETINLNGFTGVIRVTFDDGSRFDAINSIVYNTSALGKSFMQFPLRFNNVIKANGERMKGPSEKKMNEEF